MIEQTMRCPECAFGSGPKAVTVALSNDDKTAVDECVALLRHYDAEHGGIDVLRANGVVLWRRNDD